MSWGHQRAPPTTHHPVVEREPNHPNLEQRSQNFHRPNSSFNSDQGYHEHTGPPYQGYPNAAASIGLRTFAAQGGIDSSKHYDSNDYVQGNLGNSGHYNNDKGSEIRAMPHSLQNPNFRQPPPSMNRPPGMPLHFNRPPPSAQDMSVPPPQNNALRQGTPFNRPPPPMPHIQAVDQPNACNLPQHPLPQAPPSGTNHPPLHAGQPFLKGHPNLAEPPPPSQGFLHQVPPPIQPPPGTAQLHLPGPPLHQPPPFHQRLPCNGAMNQPSPVAPPPMRMPPLPPIINSPGMSLPMDQQKQSLSRPPTVPSSPVPARVAAPISTIDPAKQKENELKEKRQTDQNWIDGWLQQKGYLHRLKETKSKTQCNISVPQARSLMRQALIIMEQLRDLRDSIAEQADGCRSDQSAQADQLKSQLEVVRKKLSAEAVAELSQKMRKIQKKRERIKRKRRLLYQEKMEEVDRCKRVTEEVNKHHEQILAKSAEAAKEKEMKQNVDSILGEVRKKVSETQKAIQLVKGIQKLRQLRKEYSERQGLYTPLDVDADFEKGMNKQMELLSKQLALYKNEQRTLEVMLETEKEEKEEQEKEKRKRKMLILHQRKERNLRKWLFGGQRITSNDPLYSYAQFWESGEQVLEAFLQIRSEWDTYLVPEGTPGGSLVPSGWVMPSEPSNKKWAAALKDDR